MNPYYWTQHPMSNMWAQRYIRAALQAETDRIIADAASRLATMLKADHFDDESERMEEAMHRTTQIAHAAIAEIQANLLNAGS